MRAILLSAGLGTRLRPITDKIPKCLVLINQKPLIQYWLNCFEKLGIKEILINTHYLSGKVEKFIKNFNTKIRCNLKYEEKLMGTGGTLLDNLDFIQDQDCLFIHADNYCEDDLTKLIASRNKRPSYCLLTMMTFHSENPKSCGVVKVNDNGVVINYEEKPTRPDSNLANSACFVLSKDFIQKIRDMNFKGNDFCKDILPFFVNKIFTYHTKKRFEDIGTIESLSKINSLIKV